MFERISLKPVFPLILIIMVFASRIPIITGSYFHADVDESIVALMAKELADKGDFKVYFWGQQYGFVTLETSVTALAYKIFGVNLYSFKLSVLLLWAIGCVFFYEGAKNILGFYVAAIFAVLLVAVPAWAIWSQYIAAFVFSGAAAWIMSALFKCKDKKFLGLWLLMGVVLGLIYFTQMLFLFSLLPFIVAICAKRGNARKVFIMITGIAFIVFLIPFLARHETSNFWGHGFNANVYILYNIPTFLWRLKVHFTAAYFLGDASHVGILNDAVGWTWAYIFVLLCIMQIIRIVSQRFYALSHLLFVSVCLSSIVIFNNHDVNMNYRYLMPIDVPLILCFICECHYWASLIKLKKVYGYFMATFICFNYAGLFQLRYIHDDLATEAPTCSYSEAMKQAIDYLKSHGVYYTFSPNAGIFWQIIFYSNASVLSRFYPNTDRRPEYVQKVTKAFNEGKPTAIVDWYHSGVLDPKSPVPGIDPAKIVGFGNRFKVYLNPDRKTLENLHFEF